MTSVHVSDVLAAFLFFVRCNAGTAWYGGELSQWIPRMSCIWMELIQYNGTPRRHADVIFRLPQLRLRNEKATRGFKLMPYVAESENASIG